MAETTGLGLILEMDRGSLPFALIHGESLVACAAWACGAAGIQLVDASVEWAAIADTEEVLVLHDALCPMTPPDFIAECAELALTSESVVVAVRPVTDSVKVTADGLVTSAVDRDSLVSIVSPIVLPTRVVAAMDGLPSTDFVALAGWLASRFETTSVTAPAGGARVASAADVAVLQAVTTPQ